MWGEREKLEFDRYLFILHQRRWLSSSGDWIPVDLNSACAGRNSETLDCEHHGDMLRCQFRRGF
jgi:hypothetical protein